MAYTIALCNFMAIACVTVHCPPCPHPDLVENNMYDILIDFAKGRNLTDDVISEILWYCNISIPSAVPSKMITDVTNYQSISMVKLNVSIQLNISNHMSALRSNDAETTSLTSSTSDSIAATTPIATQNSMNQSSSGSLASPYITYSSNNNSLDKSMPNMNVITGKTTPMAIFKSSTITLPMTNIKDETSVTSTAAEAAEWPHTTESVLYKSESESNLVIMSNSTSGPAINTILDKTVETRYSLTFTHQPGTVNNTISEISQFLNLPSTNATDVSKNSKSSNSTLPLQPSDNYTLKYILVVLLTIVCAFLVILPTAAFIILFQKGRQHKRNTGRRHFSSSNQNYLDLYDSFDTECIEHRKRNGRTLFLSYSTDSAKYPQAFDNYAMEIISSRCNSWYDTEATDFEYSQKNSNLVTVQSVCVNRSTTMPP